MSTASKQFSDALRADSVGKRRSFSPPPERASTADSDDVPLAQARAEKARAEPVAEHARADAARARAGAD